MTPKPAKVIKSGKAAEVTINAKVAKVVKAVD